MKREKTFDLILSVAAAAVLWGVLALLFDFYYDLNDDVLIKDILSGIYTGTPDAHNNQMLYPISVILSGLYKINYNVPWFGFFELVCMIGSFVLIGYRILEAFDLRRLNLGNKKIGSENSVTNQSDSLKRIMVYKILYITLQTILFAGLFIWEFVNIQYTVVAGMLTVAAAVWLYTGDPVRRPVVASVAYDKHSEPELKTGPIQMGAFICRNIPAILLVILAFNIRSELVLLLSPLLAAAALAKWSEEEYRKDAFVLCGYLGVFLTICLLLIAALITDRAAYSSPEWRQYRRFFDARTDLYDFTGIPDYEENIGFYEEENISKDQYELLVNYNYYQDESIDANMLRRIADGVRSGRAAGRSTYGKTIKEAAWEYVHNSLDISIDPVGDIYADDSAVMSTDHLFADETNQHKPFNLIVIVLYIVLIINAMIERDKTCIIKMPVFLIFRTIPWIYIYLQGRVLSRITHPLYILEITVIVVMIITGRLRHDKEIFDVRHRISRFIIAIGVVSILAICLTVIPGKLRYIRASEAERTAENASKNRLYEYTASQADTYFYIDTYSTVDWTEKIFEKEIIPKKNTQLLGGWMGNSPLDTYKRSLFGKEEYIDREEYLSLTKDDN